MTIEPPYPELDELMTMMGQAGRRLSEINATEGAAGNISIYTSWPLDYCRLFPNVETLDLPVPMEELAGKSFLVTGSGRRLREIIEEPLANLGVVVIDPGGKTGQLYTSPSRSFAHLTNEFNSHLAVHRDQIARTGTNFHAVIHAQPPLIAYLSHIPRYRDSTYLSRHLLRWQPELIVNLPEGVGVLPFLLPGSVELEQATVQALRTFRVVVWSKHGVMARSELSVKRASDRIEYAETAAAYEYRNLLNHEQAEGLTDEEIRTICRKYNVTQSLF